MNRGRSTTGGPAVPYYPGAPHKEAAKHLRLTVTRYIADRATLDDIRNAMTELVSVAPVAGDPGFPHSIGKIKAAPSVEICTACKGPIDEDGECRCDGEG